MLLKGANNQNKAKKLTWTSKKRSTYIFGCHQDGEIFQNFGFAFPVRHRQLPNATI
jgi:hypothetical protein